MNMEEAYKKCVSRCFEYIAPAHFGLKLLDADTILEDCFPDTGCSCLRQSSNLVTGIGSSEPGGGVLLSVIIPTYNNASYVTQAIDSCINQKTQYLFEVVVVNDGSTDSTGEVLEKYNGKENVRIIKQKNLGLSGARNTGIKAAKGKWLFFLDSDDSVPEGTIEAVMNAAVAHNADIVEGNYYDITVTGEKSKGSKWHIEELLELDEEEKIKVLRGFPWGKAMKRSLFEKVEFPASYWFEDTVMDMILYPIAAKCVIINAPVYNYLINPNGITRISSGKKKSIDSFYVTRRLLEDRLELGIEFTVTDYKFFLGQVRMNWSRTRLLPERVKRAIFVETCHLNDVYFDDLKAVKFDGAFGLIKKALECGNYKNYIKAMKSKV